MTPVRPIYLLSYHHSEAIYKYYTPDEAVECFSLPKECLYNNILSYFSIKTIYLSCPLISPAKWFITSFFWFMLNGEIPINLSLENFRILLFLSELPGPTLAFKLSLRWLEAKVYTMPGHMLSPYLRCYCLPDKQLMTLMAYVPR